MNTTLLITCLTALSLAGSASSAQAQCTHQDPTYDVSYYYAQPPSFYGYRAGPPRWSAGVHFTGLTTNQTLGDEGVNLGGMGGHLRYRGYRWGVEFAADVVGNDFAGGGVSRVSVPLQASALLYLIPRGRFNLYLLGGVRMVPTQIQWSLPNLNTDQTFTEFGAQLGVGAEFLLTRHFALTADLRAYGTVRNNDDPAGSYYDGSERPVLADKASGLQLSLGGSFRF